MDTDVLIVGAGPTGLMLANQLARRGVKPIIIDRHSGPAQQTRAIGVQARTLEIYAQMGLAGRALELGQIAAGANMWANGRWSARIPVGEIGQDLSPFPFVLMLGQDDNERMLGERLSQHGVPIAWNTALTGLAQRADHVEVTLRDPVQGERTVRARWVAGCDGARSAVREMNGIAFPGAPYRQTFFVADTEAFGQMKPAELNVYLWRDGFHLFFPMRGENRWRVIGILPQHLRERDDLAFEDLIPELRREAGTSLRFTRCFWFSTYRIFHRAAEQFRKGRCFVLGDAAHIHSPAGAQGMNTGLQDAYNLAWKLALVVQGRADATLLDSYAQERMPVAQRLLETTDRAFQLVASEGWFPALMRTKVIAKIAATAMRFERVQRLAFLAISQIGISYPSGSLSRTLPGLAKGAPVAGDRFPWMKLQFQSTGEAEDLFARLGDTTFNLLHFNDTRVPPTLNDSFGDLVRVHAIPSTDHNKSTLARAKIDEGAFYLLRPDGHVGMCGVSVDWEAVSAYLSEQVQLRALDERAEAA
jgi:2-polyprenyl-6-methoxyphenol hydroxylase-like FAD-dependent oxidoreductase